MKYWRGLNPVSLALLPLAGLFCAVSWLRRALYRLGWLSSTRLPVPVLVVGNITVGGTGKTPLVIALAEHLKGRGLRVGIVSRGYGGKADHWPQPVTAESDPVLVGDEPVLLARRTDCPLWVGPRRVAAAQALLKEHPCDLLLTDDGLQHYALRRDAEIAVIDGRRGFGNGFCLPAGPLRERPARLRRVDLVVANGGEPERLWPGAFGMALQTGDLVQVGDPSRPRELGEMAGEGKVHALAGIGDPERFFRTLEEEAGLSLERHPFPDHHRFRREEIEFADGLPVAMTEKDAVKCKAFAGPNHWYLPVEAQLEPAFWGRFDSLIDRLLNGQKAA